MESSQSKEEFLVSTILIIPSLNSANMDKLINVHWGSRPNQRTISERIIRENMDNGGECFVPYSWKDTAMEAI